MTLVIFFLMFIIGSASERLCPLRASIDVLEGEFFFLCYPESRQEHFQEEAYTINWYRENAGKQQLIKETRRIVSQMNFLEFWPVELSDSGNYSVTHSNGKQNFIIQKWTLNILERNESSCFNKNHLTTEIKNAGTGHSLKCSDLSVNENDSITWYKDCKNYEHETERELHFRTLTAQHSGIYTCKIIISHEGKIYHSTNTIKLIVEEDAPEAVTLEIIGHHEEIETEIGKEEILNCTGFLGYYMQEDASLYWLINQTFPEQCTGIPENEPSICEEEFKKLQLGNKFYVTRLLRIKKVTDEDMHHNFTCMLQADESTQIKIVKLKKGNTQDLPVHVFTTGMVLAVLFPFVAIAAVFVCVIFRVDLVLFYRNICRRDDTAGDGKEYDAFVSYLKDCASPVEEEREFALKILPMILEENFGYKLCIFERDVSPGGAVVDDIHSFIDKSRRLIIILSQNYVSDRAIYELESGLHKALVERKTKIILIEYMPISDYSFLPESLSLLPSKRVVKWKKNKSLPVNSRFWKNLRYLMPAKPTKINTKRHYNNLDIGSKAAQLWTEDCDFNAVL
ncbi:interleukin-18 receptor 1 isoform X1 [Manacus candei]|uniref:interleukin-18 receptor 1 isoform X1 n=1 Tax=Manacus candei TaxID=415023 RepID=UPI00222768FD|nr:interleukin-18 receptor 1 isoform X1 [Manacus candei]XP_051662822.1 interleukin-18 receptor 1 isoform X1 [Manacus candei]XP_051662823.1 interleukin-18 receptor 1 isoform X1 [Manacus candei]XP_051662824.1 interleukin-18 receptor 1 isoform X1 [Manacus candei]XP_051662825.1 interleukin-18 receptor 1 isoform X1 [Manacus candei]XP_051662826.1 interleukin-18 receptor 1 isoform X1 [Manacus candei]